MEIFGADVPILFLSPDGNCEIIDAIAYEYSKIKTIKYTILLI